MGPTDRVVILIDMDCFYCQVEEKLDKNLEGKPIAVVQYNAWKGGGIIAVNYPAREQGVTRHMRGNDAKKKCPSINLVRVPQVRGKADLTKYRDAGKRVADVLATFTPLLERASVDEAYLDITEAVKNRIETNLSDLTIDNLQNSFVVGYNTKDFIDAALTSREFLENNLKLAVGGLICEEIRREVYNKTGYKCSAGIAHNKILAKLVCSLHKPNKQTILPQEAVEKFFETMPINKIKSLGGKFGQTLSEDLQVTYMGQLKKFTEKELAHRYDEKTANWLYNIARGIDLEPVTVKLVSKSIACCKNFPGKTALTTHESVQHWLGEFAEEMSQRLNKDLEENNRKAKQMIVTFTYRSDRKDVNSSRTTSLTSYDSKKIASAAFEVVKRFCLRTDGSYHLTHLGISAGHFEDVKNVREITSFFKVGQVNDNTSNSTRSAYSPMHQNKSIEEQASECNVDENIPPEDQDSVESNVYLQLTQELVENPDDLVFYDDNCRLKKEFTETSISRSTEYLEDDKPTGHSGKKPRTSTEKSENKSAKKIKTPSKAASSFFQQYFVQTPQPQSSKENSHPLNLQNNILNSKAEELNETCPECNRSILKSDMPSHKDYHFALNLMKSERESQKSTPKLIEAQKNQPKSGAKRKIAASGSLTSFLQRESDLLVDITGTEVCPECNKRIKMEDLSNHQDYHIAKKIHLEINSAASSAKTKLANNKTNRKNKSSSATRMVTSFFSKET